MWPDITWEQVRALYQKLNCGCVADIDHLCKDCCRFVGGARSLARLRAVVFAILAVAVAIAPAVPCTMMRHAAADHLGVALKASEPHAHHRHHHARAGNDDASSGVSLQAEHGTGTLSSPGAAADASAGPGHQQSPGAHSHHKRAAGCMATCCPLACQAAVPDAPWSGDALSLRPSETLGLTQQDGVAEPRPLRIERPPRYRA